MSKKIITLTKTNEDSKCLICCENKATAKLNISRSKYGDNVISFCVCDECLSQMQTDIETCE